MQIAPKIPPNRSLTACYSLQAIDTLLYFTVDVLSATDYYPFGMQMAGRSFIGVNYKYGFNSQEKDDEIYGTGNSYTAEYWQYDARLGRRWNLDPVVKYWESPYACFAGNPVWFVDPNGDDATKYEDETGKVLANTNDGNDATVVIPNEHREKFQKEFQSAQNQGQQDNVMHNESWIRRYGVGISANVGERVQPWALKAIDPEFDLSGLGFSSTGLLLAGTSKILEGSSFRLFNQKGTSFSPKLYTSGWKGGSAGQIKTYGTGKFSTGLKWGGRALGVYNAYQISQQHTAGQITTTQMIMEQTTNLISTFGGIYGAAWGVGWEAGRTITGIPGYHENVRVPLQKALGIGD